MIVKSLFSIQRSLDRSIPISSKISRAKIQGSNDLAIKICTQPLKSNTKEAIEQEQDRILLLFPFLDFPRRSIRSEPRRIVYFSPYIHQCNTDIKIFVSFAWNLGYPSPFLLLLPRVRGRARERFYMRSRTPELYIHEPEAHRKSW